LGSPYTGSMNDDDRNKLTLWRYAILGQLVSVRLEHGDLRALFAEAAATHYEHPLTGELVQVSARTIETWYYRYQDQGLAGLKPRTRKDRGRARTLEPELVALIVRAKQERPRRSVRRIIRILERARRVEAGQLSRSTVHRVLARAGISTRPAREPERERRSFILEHVGDLWVGDVKHGPRVRRDGRVRKSYAINIIDCATRYVVASRLCLSEDAVAHEGVLKEALRTYGRPRAYYVDRGAAYRSDSLKQICVSVSVKKRRNLDF
jgi:putative transposase